MFAYRTGPLSQYYNNAPARIAISVELPLAATAERRSNQRTADDQNKTMMQQIHKASACEAKSMEQITLELRSTTILVP